jgi:hypothetical protein
LRILFENEDLLCRYLTDASQALLDGYRTIPALEGELRRMLEEKTRKLVKT